MTRAKIDIASQQAWENRRSNLRASFDAAQSTLSFSESINYPKGIANSHKILGYSFWRFTNFSSSLENSFKALNFYQKKHDEKLAYNFKGLDIKNTDWGKAKNAAKKALEITHKTGAKEEIKLAYFLHSSIFKKKDLQKVFVLYKKFHQTQEEIFRELNSERIRDITFKHEIENIKKEAEIDRLKTVELKKTHDEIAEQKSLLEQQNRDIVDSIRYTQYIQKTILNEKRMGFPEHFIFFKPKDIVSSDFYCTHKKGNYFYTAMADFTGHGVPGAFMSLLRITFLNEFCKNDSVQTPAEILEILREKIIHQLNQNIAEKN